MNHAFKTLGHEHFWIKVSHLDQVNSLSKDSTPLVSLDITTHQSRWNEEFFDQVVKDHVSFVENLSQLGVKKIGLSATDDGILHKILSPRFSNLSLKERARPLLSIFSQVSSLLETVVWLTVEELAPGGMDATDGLLVAKSLKELGLKHVVASGGTRDFPPLFYRRETQKKNHAPDFFSNEPALASAKWLLETDMQVSSVSFIDDEKEALRLGQELGLFSVIKRVEEI